MTLLQRRFGRSVPDVLSRSSGPAAGRQVMKGGLPLCQLCPRAPGTDPASPRPS